MKRLFLLLTGLLLAMPALASQSLVEATKKNAETQIRRLVEPLIDRYCHEQCKLLAVSVSVDVAVPEEVSPGFDDVQVAGGQDLVPTAATLRLLIDDKVGPVSRSKIVELLNRHLDTLDYGVKIQSEVAHFPNPLGSESRVADLRERISKSFQKTVNELLNQFCPEQCLLADFELQTEMVNPEETQYGSPGEFEQEGGVALKIKDIAATILTDESMPADERANVLEMAKLKTNSFKRVTLSGRSIRFPRPMANGQFIGGYAGDRRLAGLMPGEERNSKSMTDNKSTSATTNQSNSTAQNSTDNTNETNNSVHSNTRSNNSSQTRNSETNNKSENYTRIEKIERVENGDALNSEFQKMKVYGLVFACSILSLLIFIAMASLKPRRAGQSTIRRVIQTIAGDPVASPSRSTASTMESAAGSAKESPLARRYEIERLIEELAGIFAQHPKVAKHVFTRILTEEGVEVTAQYIHIFGEGVVVDMLRDASLQADMAGLMEFYAKTPIEIMDDEKLDLLRRLHNRTVAGKLVVLGNRSGNLFDFLTEMDSTQISELIRNESLTVKAIILTQCDAQKRSNIYAYLDEDTRMKLLAELSRIDYLPRDYIFNVANALKRKKKDNPKLNTEALPGSEVLVTLLERTGISMQRQVIRNLEVSNPESARTVKGKLVSIDTLRFLRDGQLLEVVLSLKHDELLQFLKGTYAEVRNAIYSKSPKELVLELEEELSTLQPLARETYLAVERKVLNRMKLMANEGLVNLVETNDRMFSDLTQDSSYAASAPYPPGGIEGHTGTINLATGSEGGTKNGIKKVSGW